MDRYPPIADHGLDMVNRSAITLKLLTYEPSGPPSPRLSLIMAARTLDEALDRERGRP
ncbi:hypothetical protein [Streptomyces sp. NPDC017524]|uniref:hypothetical protein n=1 Tax=Streptomyces sp. NPDC017524 TaxID=3364999 RepID=UPI0037A9621E